MIYCVPNLVSKQECEFLLKQFDIEKTRTHSADSKLGTNNSFGFRPSAFIFNDYMENLKNDVLKFAPNEIIGLQNINTYVREYRNESFLSKHIDRTDISVTMSICLESTINKEWALCAEIEGKEYCFNTNVGDAIILFNADKTIHWRDTLICNENERVVQLFLHWSPINYVSKKTKSLL